MDLRYRTSFAFDPIRNGFKSRSLNDSWTTYLHGKIVENAVERHITSPA